MPELYRLEGKSERGGKATLVLTDSHIILEPDPSFRAEIEDALARGREGAEKAPGVIGWFVGKAINFAGKAVEKVYEPHPLKDVELLLKHDRVEIRLGMMSLGSDLLVDPTEAFIFDAKFRDAKDAVK